MRLYHKKLGVGSQKMIIIHGLYGSSDNWLTIARLLENQFQIYIVDQRNHGRSPHNKEMNYEVMADDLNDFMDGEDMDAAIVMGHSMGGKTAMRFALKYPERVNKLVILDIAPKKYGDFSNYAKITNDHRIIVDALLAINPFNFSSRSEIDKVLKVDIPNDMVRSFLLKNIGRGEDKKLYWKLNVTAISACLPEIMDGFSHLDSNVVFPVEKEVFVIKGAHSSYVQDEDMQQISQFFPSAQLSSIANAGHWLHAEQTELFIKTVKYFLGSK